jgi:hypothetical protein
MTREYVDSCRTYEILLQDSGLLPPPQEDWNSFIPEEGMIAHVDEDNIDYRFNGTEWEKMEVENNGLQKYRR